MLEMTEVKEERRKLSLIFPSYPGLHFPMNLDVTSGHYLCSATETGKIT